MKNRKLSARAVVSLMLSAILFCMPIGAFFANRTNTIEVHAEDTAEQKTESAAEEGSAESTAFGTDNKMKIVRCVQRITRNVPISIRV